MTSHLSKNSNGNVAEKSADALLALDDKASNSSKSKIKNEFQWIVTHKGI